MIVHSEVRMDRARHVKFLSKTGLCSGKYSYECVYYFSLVWINVAKISPRQNVTRCMMSAKSITLVTSRASGRWFVGGRSSCCCRSGGRCFRCHHRIGVDGFVLDNLILGVVGSARLVVVSGGYCLGTGRRIIRLRGQEGLGTQIVFGFLDGFALKHVSSAKTGGPFFLGLNVTTMLGLFQCFILLSCSWYWTDCGRPSRSQRIMPTWIGPRHGPRRCLSKTCRRCCTSHGVVVTDSNALVSWTGQFAFEK